MNAGGLQARSTKILHFLLSHPVDLICIQESNLNFSSSFRISGLSALRSHHSHSRSGILSSDTTHASGGIVIFVRQGLSFSALSTSSLSSPDPYSDYVGIKISLDNSSLSFLNVYAPPICSSPTDGRSDSFSPSILPSSRNLFILGDFNCHHPPWGSKVTSDPCGEEVFDWVISSDLLPSMTLTHPPFSIAPLAVASSLTSPMLPPLLPFLAPGRCYRTWVLTIYQFFHSSLSLSCLSPQRASPFFNFQKACWNGFASYFDSHCPSAKEYSSLSLSSAAALFTSLALNGAKPFIPFGHLKRSPKAWWSAEVEQAVSERRKAFAAAHRSDEDRQAYISASRRASSVIAKAKAEAW